MLLDYDNLHFELSAAINTYYILQVPIVLDQNPGESPDHRTFTYYMKQEDFQNSINLGISMMLDNKSHLLVECTRRNGEKGYKVPANIEDKIRKLILKGSQQMTSTDKGKSMKFRFIPMAMLTEETKQKIKSVQKTFKSFINTATLQILEENEKSGFILISKFR